MTRIGGGPRSFGDQITLAVTATSGLAVVVAAVLLALVDYGRVRRETTETASSLAELVTINSGAALVFDDPVHGADALDVLRAVPEVAAAVLFEREGEVFAEYRRAAEPIPDLVPETIGTREEGRWLFLTLPVYDREQLQGRLQVAYDLRAVEERLGSNLVIALLVSAASMLLAYLVARRIRRDLAAPIDELVRVATGVTETRDFSLRAARRGDDELGRLTRAFNEMLAQIGQQERELQASHAERGALLESERAARAEAERASRMKDEFVATVSHELRTPLTPILGWVEVLRLSGPADEQTRRALEVIERNVHLQAQLIDDLLDISRIVSGKVRLEVQPVEPAEVIEAALATVRPAAEAREIRLDVRLDREAGPADAGTAGAQTVRADPGRLQQIVWNLLSNAIKFTDRGGRVEVRLRRRGSQVEIAVSDSGKGIDPDFLPHVFERFRQADSSITRRHGGLGLGLAIVRQLVELHGGTVRAESPGENLGATFTVSLPVMAVAGGVPPAARGPRDSGAPAAEAAAPPSLAGLSVLVVDDDRDARELLSRVLEHFGAEVQLAASAAEGLQVLRSARPDVLVSDIGMPDVDGYELIRRVRDLEDGVARTPAIALTAFARAEDRERALEAGYQVHVAKPVDPGRLVAAVASLAAAGGGQAGDVVQGGLFQPPSPRE